LERRAVQSCQAAGQHAHACFRRTRSRDLPCVRRTPRGRPATHRMALNLGAREQGPRGNGSVTSRRRPPAWADQRLPASEGSPAEPRFARRRTRIWATCDHVNDVVGRSDRCVLRGRLPEPDSRVRVRLRSGIRARSEPCSPTAARAVHEIRPRAWAESGRSASPTIPDGRAARRVAAPSGLPCAQAGGPSVATLYFLLD